MRRVKGRKSLKTSLKKILRFHKISNNAKYSRVKRDVELQSGRLNSLETNLNSLEPKLSQMNTIQNEISQYSRVLRKISKQGCNFFVDDWWTDFWVMKNPQIRNIKDKKL